MKKNCYDCGRTILGRRDKKFCSELCRNNFHNRHNSESESTVRLVNSILRRNRKILSALVRGSKVVVETESLNQFGFNFSFYTSSRPAGRGKVYYRCYEFEYLPASNNQQIVVKRTRVPDLRKNQTVAYGSTA